MPSKAYIRIIEPISVAFSGPEVRLKQLKTSLGVSDSEGFFTLITYDNAVDLMLQHKGHEDVRINTFYKNGDIEGLLLNIDDIINLIADGHDVYQYVIRYTPVWIRNRRHQGPDDVPDDWIKADQVAEIKRAEIRTVNEHCRNKRLTCKRYLEGDYYIKPDEKLDYWIKSIPDYGALHRRLLLIRDVLDARDPETVTEMFEMARDLEKDMNIRIRGAKSRVLFSNFVEQSLGEKLTPRSIEEWRRRIRALIIATKIKRDELYDTGRDSEQE